MTGSRMPGPSSNARIERSAGSSNPGGSRKRWFSSAVPRSSPCTTGPAHCSRSWWSTTRRPRPETPTPRWTGRTRHRLTAMAGIGLSIAAALGAAVFGLLRISRPIQAMTAAMSEAGGRGDRNRGSVSAAIRRDRRDGGRRAGVQGEPDPHAAARSRGGGGAPDRRGAAQSQHRPDRRPVRSGRWAASSDRSPRRPPSCSPPRRS